MSDERKMGVTLSTAIATSNAVVRHLKLGIFISEYNKISDYLLRIGKFAGNFHVQVEGRTNDGKWIYMNNTVVYKDQPYERDQFPIEKVYVGIRQPQESGAKPDKLIYFECTFEGDIVVKELEKSPHE